MFFPPKGRLDIGMTAQLVCLMCEVRTECLDYRKRTDSSYGIWGGEYTKRGE